MYETLYVITGLAFVAGVLAYSFFCIQLSQDIAAGRIKVKAEAEASK